MALTKALFAGDDPTPESVKRRRAMAAALLAEGSQIKHVDSPLEMIGSLLQSGAGALNNYRADQDEKAGRKTRSDAQIKLAESAFGPGGAGAGFGSATGPIGDSSGASVPAGDRASYIRSGLVSRGLPEHVADGFLVNFKDESGLDPGINEKAPLVAGSRGGFGLYQLTGPRRTAYEGFARSRGVDPSDIDTQLDFMVGELGLGDRKDIPGFGSESRAARSILSASDTSSAAQAIVNNFLRPAPEHRASRTRRYAGLQNSAAPVQVASLDPSAGMAAATGAPRSTRQVVEDAVERQEATPAEFGAADVREIQNRPRDPQAVPYSGPGATIDPRDVRGLTKYTGPALRDPNGMAGIAPVGMPGSAPEADAAIQRFHAESGTTPMQYRGPGQSGVPSAPGAQIDDPGAMQAGAQVAALDPAAGQPRTVRQIAEAAVEQQEQAAAPVPTPRPELMAAAPLPQARPSPVNAQGYATELPTAPPPPAQRGGDPQQMGQMLLAGQSQGTGAPQSFGQAPYSQEMIAQLLGNPWTEDLGQQALQEVMQWRERNQAMAIRQQELQQTRAYEERVRREGYGREDARFAITDRREDARLQLEQDAAEREASQPIEVGGVLLDRRTLQPVYQAPAQPFTLQPGETRFDGAGNQIAAGGTKPGYRTLSADEVRTLGLPPGSYQAGPDGKIDDIGGKSGITINTGENGNEFVKEGDKSANTRLSEVIAAGQSAPTMLADVRQLADLGTQIGTGKIAQVKTALGPYAQALGIDIGNLGEAQAYQAIIARMAPNMRPAGSGATSDFDARQFLAALPSLGNTPEGNQIITDTFEAVAQNHMQAGELASLAYLPKEQGGLTWQEAEKRIRALPNPYQRFREIQRQRSSQGVTSAPASQPTAPNATMPNGQRYEGGVPVGGAAQAPMAAPQRATNPATGETLELRNGQWVPVQ